MVWRLQSYSVGRFFSAFVYGTRRPCPVALAPLGYSNTEIIILSSGLLLDLFTAKPQAVSATESLIASEEDIS